MRHPAGILCRNGRGGDDSDGRSRLGPFGTSRDPRYVDSGLCLADRRQSKLRDIIALSRPRGGLAFLSACQTAASVSSTKPFIWRQRGVIGTMWSISDKLAPDVARDAYEQLFENARRPYYREVARALHDAIGRVRESGSASFVVRVPFIHVGL